MPEVGPDVGVDEGPDQAAAPLSIGEVLSVLAEEFPDVTISKIRFLESQGLVRPERNASGYRQFRVADVDRLRWILRQQRDHFLPLKVIKNTLDKGIDLIDAGTDQPTLWTAIADEAAASEAATQREVDSAKEVDDAAERTAGESPRRHHTPADVVAALQEDPRAPADRATLSPEPAALPPELAPLDAGQLGRKELLELSELTEEYLEGLEEFGLLEPRLVGGEPIYDGTDLLIAQTARRCAQLGVGPRHLRIYRVSAVREAGLVEQIVMPLLKKRNPASKAEAVEVTAELSALGSRVHAAVLARELGTHLAP